MPTPTPAPSPEPSDASSRLTLFEIEFETGKPECHLCELKQDVVVLFNMLTLAEFANPSVGQMSFEELLVTPPDYVPERLFDELKELYLSLIQRTPLAETFEDVMQYAFDTAH